MTAASRCRRWPVLLAVLLAGACGAPVGPAVAGLADGLWIEVVGLPAPQIETACAGSPLQVRSVRGLVPRGHAARRRAASSAVVAGGSGGSP